LSNAVKFTPSAGRVWLDFNFEDKYIVVQVSDTGIGIPTADMPRLFERFYRSELSIQQEIPGTGLGLAISREIIQRHNGAIEVYSEIGKGSTFRVLLPVIETHRPEICLIGVESSLHTIVNQTLSSEYFLTNLATIGSAWSQLPLCPPVMFIIAMNYPNEEACDFMRRLRMEPRFNPLPILAVSTSDFDQADVAYQSGADAFISANPITPGVLRNAVMRLLCAETTAVGD
jgi:CheY-like chemotaxis protein